MSPKQYSRVFRTLFNGTYSPWNLSEQVLDLLSHTSFTQGIVAGTPQNITISQKFGEHTNTLPNGSVADHELHNCGIVYYPDHPYFLCIMTRGKTFSDL